MMSSFGHQEGTPWLDVGGGTAAIYTIRAQLELFERIVVLDIC
jgi:ubiquinone/menaquinone biosynthesis C-methylase UbiE